MDVLVQEERKFALPLPFCAIWAPSGFDEAHPQWWGWISLLSLLNQMLISTRNTLPATPRNNVLPALWAALSPVKLTHRINWCNYLDITDCLTQFGTGRKGRSETPSWRDGWSQLWRWARSYPGRELGKSTQVRRQYGGCDRRWARETCTCWDSVRLLVWNFLIIFLSWDVIYE